MSEYFSPESIDFLWGIRFNNNREWFQEHKPEYQKYLWEPMQKLVRDVGERFSMEGTILKPARIYRDVRFSGGIPYKEHLWFCVREDGVYWSEHPSLYFQIEPEGGRIGFGFYSPNAALLQAHRDGLLEKPEKFGGIMDKILKDGRFHDDSECYKRPKPGQTEAAGPWYQLKRCFVEHTLPAGDELFSDHLADIIAGDFERLQPLYDYFRFLESKE